VVANRLASANYRVLLLERGGEPNPLQSVPGVESLLSNNPQTDYAYRTVPQNNSCLAMERQVRPIYMMLC
jgi:choline dehydrogenase-like flavoprotein